MARTSELLKLQIVAQVFGRDVTRSELSAAFDRVANKQHWKNEIDCVVDIASDFDMAVVKEAVVFFTGSVARFDAVPGGTMPGCRYRVRAAGYFNTIGA